MINKMTLHTGESDNIIYIDWDGKQKKQKDMMRVEIKVHKNHTVRVLEININDENIVTLLDEEEDA